MNVSTPKPFDFDHLQQTPPQQTSQQTPQQQQRQQQQRQQQQRQPALKHIFDSVDQSATRSDAVVMNNQPASPPDLLHDSEEDDEDSLSTPSLSLSPKQGFLSSSNATTSNNTKDHKNRSYSHGDVVRPFLALHHRRKSVPHRSPSIVGDTLQASLLDKSVVFQLNVLPRSTDYSSSSKTPKITESEPTHHDESGYIANQSCPDCGDACDIKCTSKVICGQSLLSALRKRVAYARSLQQDDELMKQSRMSRRKRTRTASIIEIPRSVHRRTSTSSDQSVGSSNSQVEQSRTVFIPDSHDIQSLNQQQQYQHSIEEDGDYDQDQDQDQHELKRVKKSNNTPRRQSSTAHGQSSGRPSRVKGPCQACQEASDGCMRKAFNWPFPASQIFNDKGKPFVYLCNKCGLR